jgi:hypothetical protein
VAKSHRATTSPGIGPQRVGQIAATLPDRAWNRYSAGKGAKGPRDCVRDVAGPHSANRGADWAPLAAGAPSPY